MASRRSLRCSYPARAIKVSGSVFDDATFRAELTNFLAQLDNTQIDIAMPHSRKGGNISVEERDSASPCMVTELLMSLLAPYGEAARVPTIEKRVRDDICWNSTKLPWRRSPMWMSIKIAIRLVLANSMSTDYTSEHNASVAAKSEYKNFLLFLIARLGDLALGADLPSDDLFVLNAKLARRGSKFSALPAVSSKALEIARKIGGHLDARWKASQVDQKLHSIKPSEMADVNLGLRDSARTLRQILARAKSSIGVSQDLFDPAPIARLLTTPGDLPSLNSSSMLSLSDFETWVSDALPAWLIGDKTPRDCTKLFELTNRYYSAAKELYSASSEHVSLMLLTIMDLWCALDIVAVKQLPLLEEYSPEIPARFCEPLLLPQMQQLLRLRRIENRLEERHRKALKRAPSVFGRTTSTSFSVKYYASSRSLQSLRRTIEEAATKQREAKKKEHKQLSSTYSLNLLQVQGLPHQQHLNKRGEPYHQPNKCGKCILESKSYVIAVHEWPLPNNDVQANSAVFELRCPEAFAAWRDCTWLIIEEIGRPMEYTMKDKVEERLPDYTPLSEYYDGHQRRLLTYGSRTKAYARSHYGKCTLPKPLDAVLVNNALQYELLDKGADAWTVDQTEEPSLDHLCFTKLPAGPYKSLQWTVDSCYHSQNAVIAKQMDCSSSLTLHEYIAFGSLRAGPRLQWLNLLRELASSDLHFNSDAVGVVVIQAVWQAGASHSTGNVLRDTHLTLQDSTFSGRLLGDSVQTMPGDRGQLERTEHFTSLNHCSPARRLVIRGTK